MKRPEVLFRVLILVAAYEANGRDAGRVADWYNVHPDQVPATFRFESRLAA